MRLKAASNALSLRALSWALLVLACSSSTTTEPNQPAAMGGNSNGAAAGSAGQSSNSGGALGSAGAGGGTAGTQSAAGSGGSDAAGSGGMISGGAGGAAGEPAGGAAGEANGGNGGSAGAQEEPLSPGGSTEEPPLTWQEHWFEHVQNLERVDYNEWVVLYYDAEVDRAQTAWMMEFLTNVWRYTVQHYGQFTDGQRDGRLYAIFHQGKYSGGHPSTYFDESHDFRNVSDAGPGPWPEGSYDLASHEVSHIVEGASRGVHGSPQFGLWGDSKWAEFYQYDLYVALGMTEDAERVFDSWSNGADSFPQEGSYWFRDWFYPLWRDYGGVSVMVNYFQLLAQHFPKNGDNYARSMNFGEFVHFMSGAVETDLKEMATLAFGWPAEREAEFVAAQAEFDAIQY